MPLVNQRWDPNSPQFVTDVLRVMIGLWVAVSVIGSVLYTTGWLGFLIGGAFAIVLYLVAVRTGYVVIRTNNYGSAMKWLLLSQFLLWVVMALLLAVVKINAVGFIIGASILLVAVLVTLAWYTLRKRRMPS